MSLERLQAKIGVVSDGIFGPATLKAATEFFKLTPVRSAHFFGQISHETANFKLFSENLNYSEAGLRKVFRKYFPTAELARSYARKPEKIANRVYANRMGNGPEESGDGWKYRGRGALQLTGKNNYSLFSAYLKDASILHMPDKVATEYSFESAKFYFDKNNLWTYCDRGINDSAITIVTKKINGGYHGLEDRKNKTKKYANWLGI